MNGFLKKAGMGIALAATTIAAAAPAEAQRWGRYRHYDRGGRGGDVAAGALLGGIVGLGIGAAVANGNRDRYYDRGYYYDAPPPPPPPRRSYYYDDYRSGYRPACWTQWRWDPYWGRDVPVRVCN